MTERLPVLVVGAGFARAALVAHRLLPCTGPDSGAGLPAQPQVHRLAASGALRPDALGPDVLDPDALGPSCAPEPRCGRASPEPRHRERHW